MSLKPKSATAPSVTVSEMRPVHSVRDPTGLYPVCTHPLPPPHPDCSKSSADKSMIHSFQKACSTDYRNQPVNMNTRF